MLVYRKGFFGLPPTYRGNDIVLANISTIQQVQTRMVGIYIRIPDIYPAGTLCVVLYLHIPLILYWRQNLNTSQYLVLERLIIPDKGSGQRSQN
jgi:hypothetical protein